MPDLTTAKRQQLAKQGKAMPDPDGGGGRFPIRNREDLLNAIRAVGRAKGGEEGREKVRRYIMRRATELGLSNLIPDTWRADGSLG